MISVKRGCFLAVLCVLVFAPRGRADDLYNNLGATPGGADSIGGFGPLADSFSTGASSFNFTSLTVLLNGNSSSGTITASLLGDSSTSPGAVLETIGTLSETSLSGSNALFNFSTSYTLAANTRYWIELSANDNSANWSWSFNTSGIGVAGEYFANQTGGVSSNVGGPYQMEVAGAVPEPGTLILLGTGLLGLMGAKRRKRLA